MKRMLIGGTAALMAAAAFAAPAQAQDDSMVAPCGGDPLVECVRDALATTYHPPCHGDPVTECVRELANKAIDIVNDAGPIIGDACEIVFPTCAVMLPTP